MSDTPVREQDAEQWHPTHRLGVLGCNACGCGGRHPDHKKRCPMAPITEAEQIATLTQRLAQAESQLRVYEEALKEVARWFDGWCPTATCCAHTGKEVQEQVLKALASPDPQSGATKGE